MRDDEPVVCAPGVHTEAALAAATIHERSVHDLEAEAKAIRHLVSPLEAHRSRARDQNDLYPLAEQEFLQHESGLDGLPQANIVSDEKVRSWQGQRSAKGLQLMRLQLDSRSKRGLE